MKIRVGIIFGGNSKEREISFAGGRTVYDNLNKELFEAIPVFVDSFNRFILLNWEFVYKGSIRDFYPQPDTVPHSPGEYQIYTESMPDAAHPKHTANLGTILGMEHLAEHFDLAFLCLHGPNGEDGRIQGLLEFAGIPYTGSGIFSSAVGINKITQKKLMKQAGFLSPPFITIDREAWLRNRNAEALLPQLESEIGFPLVVKSPTQGSSIGVTVVARPDAAQLAEAIDRSLLCAP